MFKNKMLNEIVGLVDKYRIQLESIEADRKKVQETYKGITLLDKLQDLEDREKDLISSTMNTIEAEKVEAINNIRKEYKDMLSGKAITEDIKILESKYIKLDVKEAQELYNRYREQNNILMMRAIQNYSFENNLNIAIDTRDISDLENAINSLFDYVFSYCNSNNFEWNTIKLEYFTKIDEILEGTNNLENAKLGGINNFSYPTLSRDMK